MATASLLSVNLKNTGTSVKVPDNDVARLMYYLHCVTVGVGLDILDKDLVNYQKYRSLSPARTTLLYHFALQLNPDVFIDKVIFKDDDGELITGTSKNEFCDISVACDVVSLQRDIVIAGKAQSVTKAMFFKSSWLDKFYIRPIATARTALGTMHCTHCKGNGGMCVCEDCPRGSKSQCRPLLSMFIDLLSSPPPPSTPAPPPRSPTSHKCICDGCRKADFEGTRYKCAVCADYDLCRACYKNNLHSLHRFMQIDRPGSLPIDLHPRTLQPQPPPPPRPAAQPSRNPFTPSTASPYFYNDMSVSELKKYLTECGVTYMDILDRETLCRRVWEAHCDSMSVLELNTFLTENKISISGCRDIASRRQKAKESFQTSRPTVPKRALVPVLQRDDVATLTGLDRAEMNGKRVTVVEPDCGGGRAEVCLESGRKVKVKFENLSVAPGDSDEYLD